MGKVKDLILGIAIAIIFAMFIGFGIEAFYPSPERDEFCGNTPYDIEVDSCPNQDFQKVRPVPMEEYPDSCWCEQDCSSGTCITIGPCHKTNPDYKQCQDEFRETEEDYNRNLFIATSIIGLIAMLVGGFVLSHTSVSPGLMGGGFITIIYGLIRYWRFAGDKLKFVILGLILALLIYVAYKKWPGEDKKTKKKFK